MTVTGNVQKEGRPGWGYVPTGEKATFALEDVAEWGAMRCYGRSQRFTLAKLRDGRVVVVYRSHQPKEVAKEIERRTKGLDVSSPAETRASMANVAWREA